MALWKRRTVVGVFYSTQLAIYISGIYFTQIWQFLIVPVALSYSFITIGLITSDFLTPNLSILSRDILGISDRISGMTLLAFGNSIPDITSTYQSIRSSATPLALGELLGAIFFLLTVVIGLMPLVGPIELSNVEFPANSEERRNFSGPLRSLPTLSYKRSTFMKDLLLFSLMILLSLVFLYDGRLMFWECFSMTAVYSVYVIYLLYQKDPITDGLNLSVDDTDDDCVSENLNGDTGELVGTVDPDYLKIMEALQNRKVNLRSKIRNYLRTNYVGCMRLNLRDILDLWESNEIFDDKEVLRPRHLLIRRTTSQQDFRQLAPTIEVSPSDEEVQQDDILTPLIPREVDRSRLFKSLQHSKRRSLSADHLVYLDSRFSSAHSSVASLSLSNSNASIDFDTSASSMVDEPNRDFCEEFAFTFKVVEFCKYDNIHMPTWETIIMLVTTPVMIILTILIPIPHNTHQNTDMLSKVMIFQVGISPAVMDYFITGALHTGVVIFAFIVVMTLFFLNSRKYLHSVSHYTSVVAFALSVSAITYVVRNVVSTLKYWVEFFNISESILGLTVFAWGNSIGDLVSNITFTRIGVLDIALGACFGGPLLYFLFGIGIDGMLIIPWSAQNSGASLWKRYIEFQVDPGLVITCIGLLIAFGIYVIVIPLNHWRIDKKIGILFLTLYGAITGINIYLELK